MIRAGLSVLAGLVIAAALVSCSPVPLTDVPAAPSISASSAPESRPTQSGDEHASTASPDLAARAASFREVIIDPLVADAREVIQRADEAGIDASAVRELLPTFGNDSTPEQVLGFDVEALHTAASELLHEVAEAEVFE